MVVVRMEGLQGIISTLEVVIHSTTPYDNIATSIHVWLEHLELKPQAAYTYQSPVLLKKKGHREDRWSV